MAPLTLLFSLPGFAQGPVAALSAQQVGERMARMDEWRARELQSYTLTRRYTLENKRFRKRADMTVRMSYTYPGRKTFEVLSEKGPSSIRNRVFRKMIDAEIEAAQDGVRNQTRITPENYEFRLLGDEVLDRRTCYVIEVKPKIKNRFLLNGRIWVDAEEFAIARIEGSPAQNPSFWTRKIHFVHLYEKVGPFWLPASNRSETEAVLFGSTDVAIEYFDYRINGAPPGDGNFPRAYSPP